MIAVSPSMANVTWTEIHSPYLDHDIVYYKPEITQNVWEIRQGSDEEQVGFFPAGSSSGIIVALKKGVNFRFSIAVAYNISEELCEGDKSDYFFFSSGILNHITAYVHFGINL